MIRSRIYPIADKALDGHLEERLRKRRGEGASCETIARELDVEGITVSGQTIRTWCHELGIEADLANAQDVAS